MDATDLASALSGTAQTGNKLTNALKGFTDFLAVKPGSGSNDSKYKKVLKDAGLSDAETGIGD